MAAPNEYNSTSFSFPQFEVSSLIVQQMNPTNSFLPNPNLNLNNGQFNDSTFISNAADCVYMLPTPTGTSINSTFCENIPNMKLSQNSGINNQSSGFNVEAVPNPVPQSMYWTNQLQVSQFDDLSHEILQNINDDPKTCCSNSMNTIFSVNQPLSNLNLVNDRDKLSQNIAGTVTEDKNNSYNHENMDFLNSFNFNTGNEVINPTCTVNPAAAVSTDYQLFKSNSSSNAANLISNTFQPNTLSGVTNNQQSFVTLPTSIRDHFSPSTTLQQGLPQISASEISDQFMFQNSSISTGSGYHEIPEVIYSDEEVNRISSPFAKAQYSSAENTLNPSVISNTYSMEPKTSFDQFLTYIDTVENPVMREDHIQSRIQERSIVNHPNCSSSMNVNSCSAMKSKPILNDSLAYSNVVVRSEGNYNISEMDKAVHEMTWDRPNNPMSQPVAAVSASQAIDTEVQVRSESPALHSMASDDRPYSYFDSSLNNPQSITNSADTSGYFSNINNQYLSNTSTPVPVTQSQATVDKTNNRKRKTSKRNQNSASKCINRSKDSNQQPSKANAKVPINSHFYNFTSSSPRVNVNQQQYSSNNFSENVKPYVLPCPSSEISTNAVHGVEGISDCLLPPLNSSANLIITNSSDMSPNNSRTTSYPTFRSSSNCTAPHFSNNLKYNETETTTMTRSENDAAKDESQKSRSEVIVPDIEEEFKFLFDPDLPNYKLISSNDEEELCEDSVGKPTFSRQNIDFLSSYKRFLENNRENDETLADKGSKTVKTWNRCKIYQPTETEANDEQVPNENTPVVEKANVYNFENVRSRSSNARKLWYSSSENEDGADSKTHVPSLEKSKLIREKSEPVNNKKVFRVKKKKKITDVESAQRKSLEPSNVKADPILKNRAANVEEIKTASKVEKNEKLVPRRKVSERKAKSNIEDKIRNSLNLEDDSQSSSDSDPSWTPQEDDGNISKRRSNRFRTARGSGCNLKYLKNDEYDSRFSINSKVQRHFDSRGRKINHVSDLNESFLIPKNFSNVKRLELWKRKDKILQRFEEIGKDGKMSFCSTFHFKKLSDFDLSMYQEAKVNIIEDSENRLVVELRNDIETAADLKAREVFMKEYLQYRNQFCVYIQTLVSQALDCNFFREIVKENDVYFLNNMKEIDNLTDTYLSELSTAIEWKNTCLHVLVKTWPFLSLRNIRNENEEKCKSCSVNSIKQTAIFYGQPYDRQTLEGIKSNINIPNNLNKTVDLCNGCAKSIKLFNLIWHQKYHIFVECAKYVAKKKAESKKRGATDILNELLADSNWISKLFYDFRNIWLQIRMTVKRTKGS